VQIAIPLFDRFTALDAVGPYEVLSRLPGATVTFVGEAGGPVRTDTGALAITVDRTFDEVPEPDVVVVPGGPGTRAMLEPAPIHAWVAAAHASTQWTTSVCTGSLVLGAAGVLDGLEATTHWASMDLLASLGVTPVDDRRVVVQGKVVTAAGVSSGIDMALWLAAQIAGDDVAKAIQLGIEYDPQPPFDHGSVHKADPEIVAFLRQVVVDPAPAS
jgi:putative intracellular protease/amidase